MQTLSKFELVPTSCIEYVHPWTDSCWNATAGLLVQSSLESFRIYTVVYVLSLIMRGRIPKRKELENTILGILQSTAFLTTSAFSYSMYMCTIRHFLGGFNFFTASYIPAFLSSLTAILLERPSRRNLLCLYVANVATETLWKMGVSRGAVTSIKHGQVIIFGVSAAILLYYFKSGLHLEEKDSVFDIMRFIVGKDEEKQLEAPEKIVEPPAPVLQSRPSTSQQSRTKNHYLFLQYIIKLYKQLTNKLKSLPKANKCKHQHSCIYYTLSGGCKLFSIGFAVQLSLRLLSQSKKLIKFPGKIKDVIFSRDTLKIGGFLGGFSFIYRVTSCFLRYITNDDSDLNAIPATLLASFAFMSYPDKSAALYIMWKMLQITYNLLARRDFVPIIPGFSVFLYCAFTAVLFHAALIEPNSLRPSYWKFLHGLSGGRVSVMDRRTFDVWGLDTHAQVLKTLALTKTGTDIKYCVGRF